MLGLSFGKVVAVSRFFEKSKQSKTEGVGMFRLIFPSLPACNSDPALQVILESPALHSHHFPLAGWANEKWQNLFLGDWKFANIAQVDYVLVTSMFASRMSHVDTHCICITGIFARVCVCV